MTLLEQHSQTYKSIRQAIQKIIYNGLSKSHSVLVMPIIRNLIQDCQIKQRTIIFGRIVEIVRKLVEAVLTCGVHFTIFIGIHYFSDSLFLKHADFRNH